MARMTFKAGEEYALRLSKLAAGSDEIAKKAIYEGAKVVADKVRNNLESVVSSRATGDLAGSLGIAPIEKDDKGFINAKIGFDGYDRNGVPNQLKARALESGTSRQQKKPFFRPALNATRFPAKQIMKQTIKEEIDKVIK